MGVLGRVLMLVLVRAGGAVLARLLPSPAATPAAAPTAATAATTTATAPGRRATAWLCRTRRRRGSATATATATTATPAATAMPAATTARCRLRSIVVVVAVQADWIEEAACVAGRRLSRVAARSAGVAARRAGVAGIACERIGAAPRIVRPPARQRVTRATSSVQAYCGLESRLCVHRKTPSHR